MSLPFRKSPLIFVGASILLLGIIFGIITWTGYNGLVQQNETVSSRHAQVQNLLKERHDKLTELYATLQAQLAQEKAIIAAITSARASYTGENPTSDASEITAYYHVVAVVEDNQPNYLSASGFRVVMDEIAEAENKLSVGRKDYNDSVRSYNTAIVVFPSNMVAGMFHLNTAKTYWSVDGSDTAMPVFSSPLLTSSASS